MIREIKDSGIEWVGKVPADWSITKGKCIFTERKEHGNKKNLQLLSPTQKYGVIPQSLYEKLTGMKAVKLDEKTDFNSMRAIYNGDFCISLRSFQGGFEYSEYDGVVSPAYHVFYGTNTIFNPYYKYLFKEQGFISKMASLTKTFRDGKSISYADFAESLIPVPPLQEQMSIASFLDNQCSNIDNTIEKTKASIDEYKKLKQAIITQAVTKGIGSERPLKHSGIEWIGDIPENWQAVKIKWLLTECKERSENGKEEPLSMSQKYGIIPTKEMDIVPNMASSFVGAKLVCVGDLVFNKLKAHLGVFAVSAFEGLVSPDYAVYRSTGKSHLRFLEYMFKTPQCISEFKKKSTGVGAGLTRLYTDGLYSIYIPLPPMEEQIEIADYIDSKTKQIDILIYKKEQFITELENYKKSMIYEYVTGKKEA